MIQTKKRYESTFSVDETNESEALKELQSKGLLINSIRLPMKLNCTGFVHPDGVVRKCPVPPFGFILIDKSTSLDKGYFAIPRDTKISIQDGFPIGTLQWINGEWRPLDFARLAR